MKSRLPYDSEKQTGSNLPGNPILAHRKELMAAKNAAFKDLSNEFQMKAKETFTASDIELAQKLSRDLTKQWRPATLTVGGSSTKMHGIKKDARNQLYKSLSTEWPNYFNLHGLKFGYQRLYGNLIRELILGTTAVPLQVSWGDVLTATPETHEFLAPFPFHDVQKINHQGLSDVQDDSFVLPNSGNMIHDVKFDYEDSTSGWAMDEVFGIQFTAKYSSHVACGIPFTMPQTGRLHIEALLRNYYNKVMFSVTDHFGFSWANLNVTVSKFIDVIQPPPHQLTHFSSIALYNELNSDGEDASDNFSDLDITIPYSISAITEPMEAGAQMWIMVGFDISLISDLDDMASHINAILWWELKKIVLNIF